MQGQVDWRFMVHSSRGRVYLLWAVLVGIGYIWTHLYQSANINAVWTVISVIGFVYMYKRMPLKVGQMKHIYASWLVPILIGMVFSVVAVRTSLLPDLVSYLGSFWLVIMAIGYIWNGLVDPPGKWYFIVGGVNLLAAILLYTQIDLLQVQYILSAVISVWSMLMLWVFRADT